MEIIRGYICFASNGYRLNVNKRWGSRRPGGQGWVRSKQQVMEVLKQQEEENWNFKIVMVQPAYWSEGTSVVLTGRALLVEEFLTRKDIL
jgi:hypothetical protein